MSLQRLYQLDRSFSDELDKLLHDEKYVGELLGLPENELIQLVNYLSDTLNRLSRTGGSPRKCLLVLRKICGSRRILPATYEVSGTLSVLDNSPILHGGFCDAQRGSLSLSEDVCIKKFRLYVNEDEGKVKELFCKEAVVWKRLNHPNIVPFRGVTLNPLQLVSEWMPGGELREYLKENPDANLISLLLGIAEGLAYLHSCDVIHGDLKGPNIVVDASGKARIVDFGLASIIRDPNSVATNSDGHGHTPRWTAPEILMDETPASKKSDVFSFAMVIFEVFAGNVPFHDVAGRAVPASIMYGKRPQRPTHPDLTNSLWDLTQRCWKEGPQDRPEMGEVIGELKRLNAPPLPTPPEEPPVMTKGLLTMSAWGALHHACVDGGGGPAPYDVSTPPPPRVEENGHLAHKLIRAMGGGTTGESSSRPLPSAGDNGSRVDDSAVGVVIEREPLKKEKDASEIKEKPEKEKRRKVFGREKKGKEVEEAIKTANETPEEEAPKHTESATAAPVQTNVVHILPPTTQISSSDNGNDNGVAGSSGLVNIDKSPPPVLSPRLDPDGESAPTVRPSVKPRGNQSRDRTLGPSAARPNQPPADDPRNLDQLTHKDYGEAGGSPALASQLPASTSTTIREASNVPQQKKSGWRRFFCFG